MTKLRIKNRYWIAPNGLLNNPNISFKAKWIFTYIQSKPDDWDFSIDRIRFETKEWKESIRSGIKELEKYWYLKRQKYQDDKWHWHIEYILDDKPTTESPTTEKPPKENLAIKKERNKKEINNKEIKNITINSNTENKVSWEEEKENFKNLEEEEKVDKKNILEKPLLKNDSLLKKLEEGKKEKKVPLKKEKKEYWNKEVNKIIEIIKQNNDWIIAWTEKEKRQYTWLLFNKLKKYVNWKYDIFTTLDILLKKIKEKKYYATRITWPKKIYYKFEDMISVVKTEKNSKIRKF